MISGYNLFKYYKYIKCSASQIESEEIVNENEKSLKGKPISTALEIRF